MAILLFLGVSAVAGGVMLIFELGIDSFPADWLDRLPLIDSWLVPGLVLGLGFGLGSLITAGGLWRRASGLWLTATFLIGAGQLAWIALQLYYFAGVGWLQVVYLGVGAALVLLPVAPGRKKYTLPRRERR